MVLNKEHCDIIMKEAFEGITMPEYTIDDVNRIIQNRNEMMQRVIELKFIDDKSFEEINQLLGYNSNFSYNIYKKFINRVRRAPRYNWRNYNINTFNDNTEIDYLEFTARTYWSLIHAKIYTVGELCKYSQDELSKLHNMGKICTDEIIENLSILGLKLKDNVACVSECNLISPDTKIQTGLFTTLISEMLPIIYNKCVQRTKRCGYIRACVNCPYRGTGDNDCIFNSKPRTWIIEDSK